jgi:hypothetical protein
LALLTLEAACSTRQRPVRGDGGAAGGAYQTGAGASGGAGEAGSGGGDGATDAAHAELGAAGRDAGASGGASDARLDVVATSAAADADSAAPGPMGGNDACAGIFCEDFEQGQLDPVKWDTATGYGGTLAVQQQVVHGGRFALKVHTAGANTSNGNGSWAEIVTKDAPTTLRGPGVWGRAYFMFPTAVGTGTAIASHLDMVFGGNVGTGPNLGPEPFPKLRYYAAAVAQFGKGFQLCFDLLDDPMHPELCAYPPNQGVPVMRWTCMEWQFDDNPDQMTIWLDGKLVGTFDSTTVSFDSVGPPPNGGPLYNGMSSGVIGGFDTFGIGAHDWHHDALLDLYWDDLVLDTKRINCQ